jgi:predicted transcriptional regulator
MVTVKMTEVEYEAYLLYLKSVEIMHDSDRNASPENSLVQYLANTDNSKELEAGFEDINAGRITYIDPENIWESIK